MERPGRVNFSSGPCAKRVSWSAPSGTLAGRSHRSSDGISLIRKVIALQKKVLNIPDDYCVAIINGSSTGAMETLIWTLLGERPIDVLAHCVFSEHWARDIVSELKIPNVNVIKEEFPKIADVKKINFDNDVVFCMTSTTSGVSFQNTNWIDDDRKGLTICDMASAAFCIDFDWSKIDAAAFSWQKGLGGEAGFGTIVLSKRAIKRLETYQPNRAIPRIFRIVENKKVNFAVFDGFTINTPSMLCVEDFYNSLVWASSNGGIKFLSEKVMKNYDAVERWITDQNVFSFLVDESCRARNVVCLDIFSKTYQALSEENKWNFLKKIVSFCENNNVGFDFLGHIWTKPHLRIWCGPTIEVADLQAFLPWLNTAYNSVSQCIL